MQTPHPALQSQSWIGCWNQFSRHLRRALGERYSAANLSESTAAVLEALGTARANLTQADLARELNFSESSLCGLIERMRQNGLLQRERSWKDRRKSVLTLTAIGEEIFQLICQIHESLGQEVLSGMPVEQQQHFSILLAALLQQQIGTEQASETIRRVAS